MTEDLGSLPVIECSIVWVGKKTMKLEREKERKKKVRLLGE